MNMGLPAEHLRLWTESNLVVRLAVTHQVLQGRGLHDLLVVVADDGTLVEQVVCRFFGASVVEREDDHVVAVVVGDQLWRLARNVPSVIRYVEEIPMDAFPLVTAPAGHTPGISAVTAKAPSLFPLEYPSA